MSTPKPVTQAAKKASSLKNGKAAAKRKKGAKAPSKPTAPVAPQTPEQKAKLAELKSDHINSARPELSYGYGKLLIPREARNFAGVPSLFNNYAVFRYYPVSGNRNNAFDKSGKQGSTPLISRNPSASTLIEHSNKFSKTGQGMGAMPFAWADFLYCKYYGKIPNNYMMTLRRYGTPTLDNLQTFSGEPMLPLAQAVTWLSEETGNKLSEVLKFSAGLNWKEIEASVQEVIGNERGHEAQPFRGNFIADAAAAINSFQNPNDYSGLSQAKEDYSREQWGADGPYANKVYGPVNVVSKTMARDRGMDYKHDISLTFHYSANSIGDINPRVAMVDILANLLSLTYNNAKFWGGAIRYFPQHPNVAFLGDQKKFYSGDMGGFIDSFATELKKKANSVVEALQSLVSDPIGTLKKLAIGGGNMWLGGKAAQSRPQILAMRSLLTGNPVGEWHLCVGNPLNPIAMIGNLICEGIDVEFGDELGADDFPTELKATIRLKHGKPRDKGDIESMFNFGNGRLYYGEYFDVNQQEKLRASANESDSSKAHPANTKRDNDNYTSKQISTNQRAKRNSGMWGPQFTELNQQSAENTASFFD